MGSISLMESGASSSGCLSQRAYQPPKPDLTLSTMLLLKMAYSQWIGDELESKLLLHLDGACQNQRTNEIQANLSIYKDRITEYPNWKSSHR